MSRVCGNGRSRVVVESDKTWRYAFARQNSASLVADLDGKQVLNMPPHQRPPDGESAYVTVTPPEAKAAP